MSNNGPGQTLAYKPGSGLRIGHPGGLGLREGADVYLSFLDLFTLFV